MNTDSKKSAEPCGCDEGANHVCEQHWGQVTKGFGKTVPIPQWAPLTTIQDSGKRVTYASGSLRDPSEGKIKWSRILFGPMARRWAQHLTTAEPKYPDAALGVPNFMLIETEEERLRYKESALRHFMSWYYEETDEDHASAVFFNINGVEIIKAKNALKEGK